MLPDMSMCTCVETPLHGRDDLSNFRSVAVQGVNYNNTIGFIIAVVLILMKCLTQQCTEPKTHLRNEPINNANPPDGPDNWGGHSADHVDTSSTWRAAVTGEG